MLIQEAIRARTADEPFIVRKRWQEEYGAYAWNGTKILPTSTPDYCLLMSGYSKTPLPGLGALGRGSAGG